MKTQRDFASLLRLCSRLELSGPQEDALRDFFAQSHDAEALVASARQQGVAGLFYYHLERLGLLDNIPGEMARSLRSLYYGAAAQHAIFSAEARRLHQELASRGVIPFFVKGFYLASEVYKNVALRPMTDLDLVVPKEKRDVAFRTLVASGYQPVGNAARLLSDPLAYGVTLERRAGESRFLVDLHWHFFNARWMRLFLGERLESKSLWATGEAFSVDGAWLQTWAPELHFIYVAAHAFSHGFDRLINAADIALFWKKCCDTGLANRIRSRALEIGLWPLVSCALFHAARLLDAPEICRDFQVSGRLARERIVYRLGLCRRPWLAYLFLR